MPSLFYYRHIIGDYDRDTKDLSLLEHGAYRRLLDAYYANRGPLSADPDRLYRVTSAILPDEQAAVRKVAYLFFDLVDGNIVHAKCDAEIARVVKESESQKARAEKRWGKKSGNADDDAGASAAAVPKPSRAATRGDKKTASAAGANHPEKATTAAPTDKTASNDAGGDAGASTVAMPFHSHSHIKEKTPPTPPSGGKSDPEKPKPTRTARFKPPTVEQVREYCEDRSNGIDPETFVDHYTAKGWMIGKNKMKDWKASVRTWERTRIERARGRAGIERSNEDLADKWAGDES